MAIVKALSVVLGLAAAVSAQYSGKGKIYVVNITNADISNSGDKPAFACLDLVGGVTLDLNTCATFDKMAGYPYALSTSAGNCTFSDSTQPANVENPYGAQSYAYHCGLGYVSDIYDDVYGVDYGKSNLWLCTGDNDCAFDIKVTNPQGSNPAWRYLWGSQIQGVTAGHTEVGWKWVAA